MPEGNKVNAVNLGVQRATTELVTILDADSWIEPDLISQTIDRMAKDSNLKLLGAIHKPDFSKSIKGSILWQFQKLFFYNTIVNNFRIPIGRYMAFRKNDLPLTPHTIAEDTWLALEAIRQYGQTSIRVDIDLFVNFQPTLNWVDFIRQETRFIRSTEILFERYPGLKKVYEDTNLALKKPTEDRIKEISELMKTDGIPMERLMQAKDLLMPLFKENAEMMKDQLAKVDGGWEVITSTK